MKPRQQAKGRECEGVPDAKTTDQEQSIFVFKSLFKDPFHVDASERLKKDHKEQHQQQ